jgi:hypothetical protein
LRTFLKRVWNHPNIGVKGGQPQVEPGSAFPFPPSATLHNRGLAAIGSGNDIFGDDPSREAGATTLSARVPVSNVNHGARERLHGQGAIRT